MLEQLRRLARRTALRTLRRLDIGDITIRHPYTRDRIALHAFKHRGYWFYGRRREQDTMRLFARLARPGDFVLDLGGHIGFTTLYLARLVGEAGRVVVFEPGWNNLPYIRRNTAPVPQVTLVEQAVTDYVGEVRLFMEDLTGQNNSLLASYGVLDTNIRSAGVERIEQSVVTVPCTTLDAYLADAGLGVPSLVKIDVEGAELQVLRGMRDTLRLPDLALMVEVTEQAEAIYELLSTASFLMYSDRGCPVRGPEHLNGNIFCLRRDHPRRVAAFG